MPGMSAFAAEGLQHISVDISGVHQHVAEPCGTTFHMVLQLEKALVNWCSNGMQTIQKNARRMPSSIILLENGFWTICREVESKLSSE